jgi:hypothetical protein
LRTIFSSPQPPPSATDRALIAAGPRGEIRPGFFFGWFVATLGLTYLLFVFGIASGFTGLAIGGASAFLFIRLPVPYAAAEARQHGE